MFFLKKRGSRNRELCSWLAAGLSPPTRPRVCSERSSSLPSRETEIKPLAAAFQGAQKSKVGTFTLFLTESLSVLRHHEICQHWHFVAAVRPAVGGWFPPAAAWPQTQDEDIPHLHCLKFSFVLFFSPLSLQKKKGGQGKTSPGVPVSVRSAVLQGEPSAVGWPWPWLTGRRRRRRTPKEKAGLASRASRDCRGEQAGNAFHCKLKNKQTNQPSPPQTKTKTKKPRH